MNRNHIIAAIVALMVISTTFWMHQINSHERIVDSYDNPSFSTQSRIGKLDSFWQGYTGNTRDPNVTYQDRQGAAQNTKMAYVLMIGTNVVLLTVLVLVIKRRI